MDLLPESEGRLLPSALEARQLTWRWGLPALAATADLSAASAVTRLARFTCVTNCNRSRSTRQPYVSDDHHRTSTVVVDLDDQGERTFTFMVRPALTCSRLKKTCHSLPPERWLHVCSIALSAGPTRSALPSRLWRSIKSAPAVGSA